MEVLSLLVALAAVLVGPWVSYKIAKKQLTAQLVSANRQKWIEYFRNTITNYLAANKEIEIEIIINKNKKDITRSQYYRMQNLAEKLKILIPHSNSGKTKPIEIIRDINYKKLNNLLDNKSESTPDLERELRDISLKIIGNEESMIKLGK